MAADGGKKHQDTRLVHGGSHPEQFDGAVNPPVYRVSTVVSADMEELRQRSKHPPETLAYGRAGTPTHWALQEAIADLEGYKHCLALPSGLSGILISVLGLCASGDHVLVADNVYGPIRLVCCDRLAAWGLEAELFDASVGAGIANQIRPNTKMIIVESPGSLTFDMTDIPAISNVAKEHEILVLADNTWATPLLIDAPALGIDISIHSGTKYIGGHSDVAVGTLSLNDDDLYIRLKWTALLFGYGLSPDDAYLALRGLRTLSVRLKRHEENARVVAEWLQERPEIERMMCPGLPSDPGHAIWRRDFSGMNGLFGFIFKDSISQDAADRFANSLNVFLRGVSWGGYESLVVTNSKDSIKRPVSGWNAPGPTVRLHVGLEDPADLIADLDQAFAAMSDAMAAE
ncbi:MAG: cystathionine beta-lyase [Alphaproteobacteria bacterium]|nr:cystathionine beta-lyase [Alphaproteobacteria bacterium]